MGTGDNSHATVSWTAHRKTCEYSRRRNIRADMIKKLPHH